MRRLSDVVRVIKNYRVRFVTPKKKKTYLIEDHKIGTLK